MKNIFDVSDEVCLQQDRCKQLWDNLVTKYRKKDENFDSEIVEFMINGKRVEVMMKDAIVKSKLLDDLLRRKSIFNN